MKLSSPTLMLPAAMETRLRQIRRRLWLFGLLYAAAVAGSVFLVALTAAMVIDWLSTLRDPRVRVSLTVGAGIVTGIVAIVTLWWRLHPLRKATWAAHRVDATIPQLEERWTTVVSMAAARPAPASPSSQAMLQQVVHEAAAMGRLVQPQAVARPESSFPSLMMLAASMVLLLGFLSLDWAQTSVLWQRFWQPTADITATQLVSETGDVILPRGDSLELTTTLTGVPRAQAVLLLQREQGPLETIPLTQSSEATARFLHRLRVNTSFQYQVRAGDGRTAWHTIRAVDPPALADVQFTIDPPSYVTRPRLEKTHLPSRMKVLQGSRLSLRMRPSAPLNRCELALTGDETAPSTRVVTLKPDNAGWYAFETVLDADLTLVPHLWNIDGLTNEEATVCRLQVIPDQAPVARILGSNAEAAVAHDDVLKIEFEAHDDQGVAAAQLVVYDEAGLKPGESPRILHIQDIPLGNQELQKHVLGSLELDLQQLHLEPGSQISYAIRVMDNRTLQLDPQRAKPPVLADRDDPTPSDTATAPQSRQPGDKSPTGTPGERSDTMIRAMVDQENQASVSDASGNQQPDAAATAASATTAGPPDGVASANVTKSADQDKADGTAPLPADGGADDQNSVAAARTVVSALFPDNVSLRTDDVGGKAMASNTDKSSTGSQPRREGTAESPTTPIGLRPEATTEPADSPRTASPAASKAATGKEAAENPVNVIVSDQSNRSETPRPDTSSPETSSTNGVTTSDKPKPVFHMTMLDGTADTETTRRRLRITERLAALSTSPEPPEVVLNVRERVVEIDRHLGVTETGLTRVVDRQIPDADRPPQFQQLDRQLGDVEKQIAQLRTETREGQYAFIGLQMVDIGRTHVTPARERVFVALRETDVGTDRNSTLALQAVLRARELLAALLARYDRAAQDFKLADGLEQTGKMYELYIEKSQMLLREARQARNPLERKMEIVDLDQDYLDRLAAVATLRREMLAEFARVLGDDPRLLSRYLQLSRNRRASLRDQLSDITARQTEITEEIRGWQQVQDGQREALWQVLVEARLQLATPLAKDAAELAEHVEKQLPLILEPIQGTSLQLVTAAQESTATARNIALDVRRQLRDPDAEIPWEARAKQLRDHCRDLEIALDQLNFEHEQQPEVVEYVTTRLLETRVVADHAAQWNWLMHAMTQKRFASMAELDQQQTGLTTELLRVDMLGMETGLETEFLQLGAASVPADILELVRQLHGVMEAITFNQSSATFLFSQNQMEAAGQQQTKACTRLAEAEKLFDEIRRKVVAALDELPSPPPNIADLRDPTLDEFLAGLEREPNIEAQLGLPNRRRNLRVIADEIQWQENSTGMLGRSADEAQQRAMETEPQSDRPPRPSSQTTERELTDEERKQRAQAEQQQQELAKTLTEMQRRAADPATAPTERERLEELMQRLQHVTEQSSTGRIPPHLWNQLAQSDQAKAALAAIAAGKPLPDQQWNKLLSSLDDGLQQVGGRTPPAGYRRAIEQYQNRLRRVLEGTGAPHD